MAEQVTALHVPVAGQVPVQPQHAKRWLGVLTGVGLVALGFGGLDGWFYRHVSCVLETKDNLTDVDFYTATRAFWVGLRMLFGYVYGAVALFVLALLWQPRRWPRFGAALVAVLLAASLANVAQGAIGRLRPNQGRDPLAFAPPLAHLVEKGRVAFPSGEAATAFALAGVVARLFPRWRSAAWAVAVVVAAARLVNGAHYISDVAGGALLGALVAQSLFSYLERLMRVGSAQIGSLRATRPDREVG